MNRLYYDKMKKVVRRALQETQFGFGTFSNKKNVLIYKNKKRIYKTEMRQNNVLATLHWKEMG